ncbi:MAG: Peptidase M50 [Clostridia bacterium 62_21]|nr:MAG: Peptidase M50 [Clostridia bacterium 62_21]HAG07171.1 site-2 protease family protein [Peptococcaceae bacterium]
MLRLPGWDEILFLVPAILIGLTLHEFAHAYVADRLGDRTARAAGRLTLNPLVHIDVLGLILLFIAGFGWAKPVPINPYNFRGNIKRGVLLVSMAGPVSNFFIACISAAALAFFAYDPLVGTLLKTVIYINVVLAVFNLIPVPPLDGSKILAGLLPGRQEWLVYLEQYGVLLLLLLMITGLIGKFLRWTVWPLTGFLIDLAARIGA